MCAEQSTIVAAQVVNNVWPAPRSYHTSSLVVNSETSWKVFVIGGKGKIDLENEVYELIISPTGESSRPGTGVGGGADVKLKSYEMSKDGKVNRRFMYRVFN